jgi:GntP family gluconate:H+ symporter
MVLGFLVVLSIAIIILVFMLVKLKIHPIIALFITCIFLGLGLGNTLLETMALINSNFGSTMSGIALTIIFGAIIAMGFQDTGSVRSITNMFIRMFRGKRLELAPTLAAFIISIPVFGDITGVLIAPIAAVVAKRKHISMSTVGTMTAMASSLTHGLVPPTPGILAVALLLSADLGLVILLGIVISFVALLICYLCMLKYFNKEYIPPKEDFSKDISPVKNSDSIDALLLDQKNCASALAALLPLLIPVLFISSGTIANMALPPDSPVVAFCKILSDRGVALFAGVLCIALIGLKNKQFVIYNALKNSGIIAPDLSLADASGKIKETSYLKVCGELWVKRALTAALGPLLITAMGGALGGILKASPAVQELGNIIGASGIPGILIPFIMSAVLMTVCGSQTMAAMTTAGIAVGMMGALGISPAICALTIGAGTMVGYHLNNSGFWVMCEFYGLNAKQGLKYITPAAALCGVVAFAVLCIFNMVGVF